MPTYKVKSPGFYGGVYRDPNSPNPANRTVTTPKPIPAKELPSWLEPVSKAKAKKAESDAISNPPSFVDAVEDADSGLETL